MTEGDEEFSGASESPDEGFADSAFVDDDEI
jgi:hypothetical protein